MVSESCLWDIPYSASFIVRFCSCTLIPSLPGEWPELQLWRNLDLRVFRRDFDGAFNGTSSEAVSSKAARIDQGDTAL